MIQNIKKSYEHTIYASYVGYITQAVVNNFTPLLFLTLVATYGFSLEKITLITTVNFFVQLFVDLVSVKLIDRIGYRPAIVAAHLFAAAGIAGLAVLPQMFSHAYTGIMVSVILYAVGGGIIEVLISPIVEACPTVKKEAAMSLLHSFYCWGHVGVVLLSTLFFAAAGMRNWKLLALLWAAVPIYNACVFTKVPIAPLVEEGGRGLSVKELFSMKIFWVLMLMMVCAGASEQGVSQWASALAEQGLGISKTVGDLAGPMTFAVCMGAARAFYGKKGESIHLETFMMGSSMVCMAAYLAIALMPVPALGLAGCGLCGLSVGIMWPGTFSMAAGSVRRGGTALFALLALAGDVGCSAGPTLVGMLSGNRGDDLRAGILIGTAFPILMIVSQALKRMIIKNKEGS